jgi:hypothetical protein
MEIMNGSESKGIIKEATREEIGQRTNLRHTCQTEGGEEVHVAWKDKTGYRFPNPQRQHHEQK